MAVFEKDGGYTNRANELHNKTREVMKKIIEESIENNMEIEEIMYITYHSIYQEALRYKIGKRIEVIKE